jgi:hypothetical protein
MLVPLFFILIQTPIRYDPSSILLAWYENHLPLRRRTGSGNLATLGIDTH